MKTEKKLTTKLVATKSATKPKPKKSLPKVAQDFDPNRHLLWSTKKIVLVIVLCIFFSILFVFGFLASTQYRKDQLPDEAKKENKDPTSDTKHYTNNYWGLEFDYPNSWTQPIGSYTDGEYYFASTPINFIGEIESGDALIAVKTFNNWNNLSMAEWMKNQQWSFLPAGQLSAPTSIDVNGMPAQKYSLTLKNSQNSTSLWNVVVISRSTATKYVFILETDKEETQTKFQPIFDSLLSSITYRKVESNPSGN